MRLGPITIPPLTDHGSEIGLLAMIAMGVIGFMIFCVVRGAHVDTAACLVVLTGIVSAIKERWTQRSVDRMGQQLGNSAPAPEDPSKTTVQS